MGYFTGNLLLFSLGLHHFKIQTASAIAGSRNSGTVKACPSTDQCWRFICINLEESWLQQNIFHKLTIKNQFFANMTHTYKAMDFFSFGFRMSGLLVACLHHHHEIIVSGFVGSSMLPRIAKYIRESLVSVPLFNPISIYSA